ncbi:MAG: caspase family protein, partial [Tabrizicola sp.]|nr:caspase family protein [Tabrizicola sp.]
MIRQAVLGCLLWLALTVSALAEKRVALVIAAEDYDLIRPLTNPANDARAMEDLLKSLDFEVFVETNRDLRRMRRALEDFKEDAAGADVALFFFAGHGVALDGVNYLLPTDADASSPEKLAETALPLSEAQEAMKAVAPVVVMLLDACRDDPFATGAVPSDEDRSAGALDNGAEPVPEPPKGEPVAGLGRIGRADGVLFAFAAAPNQTASDGDGKNSPFTAALVRHLGTAGVELRTALTLVQQDVYDRSRGRQLPYVESGLPELVFITGEGVLPERDQLLIAMADLTPELRAEVEALAAERDMPLAPLYAALLSADLEDQTAEERARLLEEAAVGYDEFQSELQRFQSDDPRVADLRAKAEEQLSLGAFDTARSLLTEAAEIDSSARTSMRETFIARTVSEAATHLLNANAARTDLRYDLAIADLDKVTALYAEVEPGLLDRETQFTFMGALEDLGDLELVAGNTEAALNAYTRRSKFAQARVEADPTDVDWVRELVWSLTSVGNVLQQQGYLTEAETAYSSALEFSAWQADQRPDDPELMRDR